jgi:hypothetical protein
MKVKIVAGIKQPKTVFMHEMADGDIGVIVEGLPADASGNERQEVVLRNVSGWFTLDGQRCWPLKDDRGFRYSPGHVVRLLEPGESVTITRSE